MLHRHLIQTLVCFRRQRVSYASSPLVIYCRLPGLLAHAVRRARPASEARCTLAVTQAKLIRSVCPLAARAGLKSAMSVVQVRRLCPILLTVPPEAVGHQPDTLAFLDMLADLTPEVEPDGPDATYAFLDSAKDAHRLTRRLKEEWKLADAATGMGRSRLAAPASAECGLPLESLPDASVDWLWPEDRKVVGALTRLGLDTFGQLAVSGKPRAHLPCGRRTRHFNEAGYTNTSLATD